MIKLQELEQVFGLMETHGGVDNYLDALLKGTSLIHKKGFDKSEVSISAL